MVWSKKIGRELLRVGYQLRRAINRATLEPIRQTIHDRRGVSVHAGEQAMLRKVAIYVIYQPHGLAKSSLLTLAHLNASEYSVLAVANSQLSPDDRAAVLECVAGLIERPNIGYDFGAYRDGILHLLETKHDLERLVLMNDSTWYPLREDDTTLSKMEALDADVVGHIYKTESKERAGYDHLESHLLLIGPKALADPTFGEFWRRYLMSNSRASTILNGEKGFTQAMQAAGLSVKGLLSRERLLALLADLDDDALREMANATLHHREDARHHCASLLAQHGDDWRHAWLNWVDTVLASSRQHLISATFIDAAFLLGGMGFVKKTADHRFALARARVLALEAEGRIPPLDSDVRREMLKRNEDYFARCSRLR